MPDDHGSAPVTRARYAALVVLPLCAAAAAAALAEDAASPVAAEPLGGAECEVWMRERSFARSVAEHDAAAFAEHVSPGAAFDAGAPRPLRGREAVVSAWAGIIRGEGLRLSWYPQRVTIGGRQDVAWSSGPALFEHLAPDARPRYEIGTFHSVWQRDADGAWRVLFDEGAGRRPATEADVTAFRAGADPRCPRAGARD